MIFISTTVIATAISTATASPPTIAITAAGAGVFTAPSTSSGNSFSSNSSRRRSNSKSEIKRISAQFVCYKEPLRKGTDQAPYVSTPDPYYGSPRSDPYPIFDSHPYRFPIFETSATALRGTTGSNALKPIGNTSCNEIS